MNHKSHCIHEFYCPHCFKAAQLNAYSELAIMNRIGAASEENNVDISVVLHEWLHFHVRDLSSTGRPLYQGHAAYRKRSRAFEKAAEYMKRYEEGVRSVHIQIDPCLKIGTHCRGVHIEED